MANDLINNFKIEYYNIEMFIFLIKCCIAFKPAACVQQLKIEIHKQILYMRYIEKSAKKSFRSLKKRASAVNIQLWEICTVLASCWRMSTTSCLVTVLSTITSQQSTRMKEFTHPLRFYSTSRGISRHLPGPPRSQWRTVESQFSFPRFPCCPRFRCAPHGRRGKGWWRNWCTGPHSGPSPVSVQPLFSPRCTGLAGPPTRACVLA